MKAWTLSLLLHLLVAATLAGVSLRSSPLIEAPSLHALTWLGEAPRTPSHSRSSLSRSFSPAETLPQKPAPHAEHAVAGAANGTRTAIARVGDRIQRELRYPHELRQQGIEGALAIRLAVQPSGEILSAEVGRSSGFEAFDQEALRSLRAAAPFPELAALSPRVILPVHFQIK